MCVHGHDCRGFCTCVRLCVEARGGVCHPVFWRWGLSLNLELPVGLGRLASKPEESASLLLLCVGIKNASYHSWLFHSGFYTGSNPGLHFCPASSLLNEPFPQSELRSSSRIRMEKGLLQERCGPDFGLSNIFSKIHLVRLQTSVQNQGRTCDMSQLISYLSLDLGTRGDSRHFKRVFWSKQILPWCFLCLCLPLAAPELLFIHSTNIY